MKVTRGSRIDHFGYRGTVVELIDQIPDTCLCVAHKGKPGALVFWDLVDAKEMVLGGSIIYHEVITSEVLKQNEVLAESLQWMPLEIVERDV